MIPAWLTCAEAWLVAMTREGTNVEECWSRYQFAFNQVRWILEDADPGLDLRELQALANRSVW